MMDAKKGGHPGFHIRHQRDDVDQSQEISFKCTFPKDRRKIASFSYALVIQRSGRNSNEGKAPLDCLHLAQSCLDLVYAVCLL